ncbi:Pre-mRNA-splicing factor cwf16 [Tilletia horrida]|uniref:Splicing factor YJU2 n=1 Tax=Tilletia horrida TaxID=155126 RepID=A0AAN6GG81_9BASI|nr:Pre-mRNA-splicing factor cwf16 [Tilletia horrida]
MSERKVLNKYFPPDFDPSKIARRKMAADRQQVVRLMAPYSMRCNTCGEYIYKGKKFNARKETVQGENYYGIRIFRFYIKCTRCSAEITFKTDPRNTDYVAEHGASRNFEPWRDAEGSGSGAGEGAEGEEGEEVDPLAHLIEEEEGSKKKRDAELDPMKALEARTLESKREMEVLDALQDIQTRNARNERADTDAILARLHSGKGKGKMLDPEEEERRRAEEEDEVLVRKYFSRAEDVPLAPENENVAPANGALDAPLDGDDDGDGGGKEDGAVPSMSASPPTADADLAKTATAASSNGSKLAAVTVKRAIADVEPDVTALLSERARAQLAAATAATPVVSAGTNKLSVASGGGSSGPARKKQKGNAFGLVRKK